MAMYKVIVDRVEYLTTTLYVEADNMEVAMDKALDNCYSDDVVWECYDTDGPWVDCAESEDDDNMDGGFAYAC